MKIDEGINYSIISDNLNDTLLNYFKEYTIIKNSISLNNLIEYLSNFNSKRIIFFDVLRDLNNTEKKQILDLLKLRNINFVNITSNIEEVLFAEYLYVLSNNEIVIKGNTLEALNNEKILKRIGFALPFVVDLSMQLKLYGTINTIETDLGKLVDKLWN